MLFKSFDKEATTDTTASAIFPSTILEKKSGESKLLTLCGLFTKVVYLWVGVKLTT